MIRGIVLLLTFSVSEAFAPRQMMHRQPSQRTYLPAQMLDDIDAMCIVNAANLCSQDDYYCTVDDEEALYNRLESHAHMLEAYLEEMRSLVFALSDRPRLTTMDNHQMNGRVLDEIDTMCLMNTAAYCVEEECSLEDHDALVNRLQEQYMAWDRRLLSTLSAMRRLERHHLDGRRNSPEIQSLMQSIENALTMEYDMSDNKVPIGSFE